jgi:hypothetical protein
MAGQEIAPHRGDDGRRRADADKEPEPARGTAAFDVEIGEALLDAGKGRLQGFEQAPAGSGQRYAACRAIEQADIEPLLELLRKLNTSATATKAARSANSDRFMRSTWSRLVDLQMGQTAQARSSNASSQSREACSRRSHTASGMNSHALAAKIATLIG